MDAEELQAYVRALMEAQYPGRWSELSAPGLPGIVLRRGAVLTLIGWSQQGDDAAFLIITSALSMGSRLDAALRSRVNELNRQLMFGRIFLFEENGDTTATVLMQEIVPAVGMSWDHPPSLELASALVASVSGMAENVSEVIVGEFGGRMATDQEAMTIGLLASA